MRTKKNISVNRSDAPRKTSKIRVNLARKTRILLIEDNPILRDGITVVLNNQPDIKVVAVIGSGNDVLAKARLSKPHIILLDVGLRDVNEISVVGEVRKNLPDAKVIGMGFIPSQSDIVEFIEAGASGFILKDATVPEFISTIRSVAEGHKILPPALTSSLFTHVIDIALKKRKGAITKAVRMTGREREIIALIGEGLSNKEIGANLNIATFTVKSHVHNILEKLALHSRLQIAVHAHDDIP
ncbi:MAG: LuxR C-terminal-related transcriptional regulator [Bacteroidota bacterium]